MRKMLHEVGLFIRQNWYLIVAGCVLTKIAVDKAYQMRGYSAVGGEWLVLPVMLIVAELARDIYWTIEVMFEIEDEDDEE